MFFVKSFSLGNIYFAKVISDNRCLKFLLCRIAIGSIPDNKIFIVFAEHESVKNSSLLHCLLALLSIQECGGVWVKISASFNLFCQIWFPLLSTRNLSSWIQLVQYVVGKWTETLKLFTSFKIALLIAFFLYVYENLRHFPMHIFWEKIAYF